MMSPRVSGTIRFKICKSLSRALFVFFLSLIFCGEGIALAGENVLSSKLPISSSAEASATEEELVILAPASVRNKEDLLSVKKSSTKMMDGSSAEQMSRQGDGSAAAALKRVTGVTTKDGKYVIIRGLGERYSLSRFNSFYIPPLESTKKQVALDLFPTGALSAIQVDKTYAADLPGEFGGGLVTLRSRDYLGFEGFRAQVGYHVNGFTELRSYKKGSTDYLGQDDGTRALPGPVRDALTSGRPLVPKAPGVEDGYTESELNEFGRLMPKTYNTYNDSVTPLPRLQFLSSHQRHLLGAEVNHSETFAYAQESSMVQINQRAYDTSSGSQLVLAEDNEISRSKTETNLSLTHSSLFRWGKMHELKLDLLALRSATDDVDIKDNQGPGVNDFLRQSTRLEFAQRDLLGFQVFSTVKPVSTLEFKNGVSLTSVNKQTPDQREYTYRQKSSTDSLELDPEVSGNLRSWGELDETALEFQSEMAYTFDTLFSPRWSVGAQWLERNRESNVFRLQYIKNYQAGQNPDLTGAPDSIFSRGGDWILVNQTGAADRYLGSLGKRTFYSEIKSELTPTLSSVLGYHLETNEIRVDNYTFAAKAPESGTWLKSTDGLPSLSLVWNPHPAHKLYFSLSETIATPDFRELSPVRYYDDESGYEARGNSDLQNTLIRNRDVRWEFYPQDEEILSLGLFDKEFERPVEDTFLPVAGSLLKIPQNVRRAELIGIEGEIRLSARRWMRELRFIGLSMNGALMESRVDIDPERMGNLTTASRPLQGQSPWLFNTEVFYQRDPKGWLISASYNVNGPRIFAVGTDQRPDVYEQPFHQIDLNASWSPDKVSKWGIKCRNILDSERTLKMGDKTTLQYKNGVDLYASYTISI